MQVLAHSAVRQVGHTLKSLHKVSAKEGAQNNTAQLDIAAEPRGRTLYEITLWIELVLSARGLLNWEVKQSLIKRNEVNV